MKNWREQADRVGLLPIIIVIVAVVVFVMWWVSR